MEGSIGSADERERRHWGVVIVMVVLKEEWVSSRFYCPEGNDEARRLAHVTLPELFACYTSTTNAVGRWNTY